MLKKTASRATDGTGDINNYTVIYVTNNLALAEYFQVAGPPAVFDPQFTYEYTPDPSGASGQLYVTAAGEDLPAYFLFRAVARFGNLTSVR